MRPQGSSLMGALSLALSCAIALAPVQVGNAQDQRIAVLDTIKKGQWTIRFRDGSASRQVCVRSGFELVQLRHDQAGCSRVVVSNDPEEVTVQYTCKGDGYGRTTIRRETATLVQLSTQGTASERPFQFFAEARFAGKCS